MLLILCIDLGPREAYFNARPLGRLDVEMPLQLVCQQIQDVHSGLGLIVTVLVRRQPGAVVFDDQLQCITVFS